MSFSAKTRYGLVTAAILLAGAIQLARGYRMLIVVAGCLAFLLMGNLVVYLGGAKERSVRLQRKRDYYAGKL